MRALFPINSHSLYLNPNLHVELFSNSALEESAKRKLFVVISSDKGLCGGIHSSVSKATRRAFKESDVESDSPIMVVGDKSKAQLSRVLSKNLVLTFNQIGRDVPTFADAAGVTDLITKSGVKFDEVHIVYNKFVSAISYEAATTVIVGEEGLKESRESYLIYSEMYVDSIMYFSWLQGLRDGRRRHQGPRRVLTRQRHLLRSRREPRLRN